MNIKKYIVIVLLVIITLLIYTCNHNANTNNNQNDTLKVYDTINNELVDNNELKEISADLNTCFIKTEYLQEVNSKLKLDIIYLNNINDSLVNIINNYKKHYKHK